MFIVAYAAYLLELECCFVAVLGDEILVHSDVCLSPDLVPGFTVRNALDHSALWIDGHIISCSFNSQVIIYQCSDYNMYKDLYVEIAKILPSLTYCLAPKKAFEKGGSSLLRASAVDNAVATVSKSEPDLDKHAKTVYDWLDKNKPSRIRMLQTWQSAARMSLVAEGSASSRSHMFQVSRQFTAY